MNDYPGEITCAFCRTPLKKRSAVVRVRTECDDVFDLCDECYQGHRLLQLNDDASAIDAQLSLRALIAQKATLLLIRNLVTAGLNPDEPANVRLMQRIADMILTSGGSS
jgi:hypothetical protein